MSKIKINTQTVIIISVIVVLLFSIVYISTVLNTKEQSAITPIKTKAANTTYKKLIALNVETVTPEVSPTETEIPSDPSPTIEITPEVEATPTDSVDGTPTPTEVILAYNNPTVTVSSTGSSYLSTDSKTPTPKKVSSLPETGFITNGLIIFAASSLMIFFAFLF